MGYTTDFTGEFEVTPPLAEHHAAYLARFSQTRRMARDPLVTEHFYDPLRKAVGLEVGPAGDYFVGDEDAFGQTHTPDILDYNTPPGQRVEIHWEGLARLNEPRIVEGHDRPQPGLWCHWTPNEDGTAIEWDGGEKFYDYIDWLAYLIEHFLAPWGYALNGEVQWEGEDSDDRGMIRVSDNVMQIGRAVVTYDFGEDE